MAQIDYDSQLQEEDSHVGQAENLQLADISARIFQDEPILEASERDLDAHVVDADESDEEDGFMAEEVEYQEDHSLNVLPIDSGLSILRTGDESDVDMTLDE